MLNNNFYRQMMIKVVPKYQTTTAKKKERTIQRSSKKLELKLMIMIKQISIIHAKYYHQFHIFRLSDNLLCKSNKPKKKKISKKFLNLKKSSNILVKKEEGEK